MALSRLARLTRDPLGVWGTASAWPDLIVAGIMAGLFLTSAIQILRQAMREYRHDVAHAEHGQGAPQA